MTIFGFVCILVLYLSSFSFVSNQKSNSAEMPKTKRIFVFTLRNQPITFTWLLDCIVRNQMPKTETFDVRCMEKTYAEKFKSQRTETDEERKIDKIGKLDFYRVFWDNFPSNDNRLSFSVVVGGLPFSTKQKTNQIFSIAEPFPIYLIIQFTFSISKDQ